MTERAILFNAPMVRALLDGSKTQTRRAAKLTEAAHVKEPRGHRRWHPADPNASIACPYGQPGDQLWVRETHAPQSDCWGAWERSMQYGSKQDNPIIHYAADGSDRPFIEKWRPSIHMPRWASRITLEIVSVRVEHLQGISDADAIAEGIQPAYGEWRDYRTNAAVNYPVFASPRDSYRTLWESINGPSSWDATPWVWVVELRRMK